MSEASYEDRQADAKDQLSDAVSELGFADSLKEIESLLWGFGENAEEERRTKADGITGKEYFRLARRLGRFVKKVEKIGA